MIRSKDRFDPVGQPSLKRAHRSALPLGPLMFIISDHQRPSVVSSAEIRLGVNRGEVCCTARNEIRHHTAQNGKPIERWKVPPGSFSRGFRLWPYSIRTGPTRV